VEKRRNLKRASTGFVECLGCVASFIQFSASVYYKLEVTRHNGCMRAIPGSHRSHRRPNRRGGKPSAPGIMGSVGGVVMIGTKKLSTIRTEIEKALASNGTDPIQRLERQIALAKRKGDSTEVMEGLKRFLEMARKAKPRKDRTRSKS
jgi:iron only hydrogenase large subunit-like protein